MKTYTVKTKDGTLREFRAEETRRHAPGLAVSSTVLLHADDRAWFDALPKRLRLTIYDLVRMANAREVPGLPDLSERAREIGREVAARAKGKTL